jgi:pimeloyl-ACP methyl ester carboxylesterase
MALYLSNPFALNEKVSSEQLDSSFVATTLPQHQPLVETTTTMPGRSHVEVPHLGGTIAAYQTSGSLTSSKPTLVMVNSFLTNSNLYGSQYANENLTTNMNLIAIELLGHGETKTKNENWTYWDTAIMNLQVIEALEKRGEIKGKVFVLGTSQGGWITARMALLAPERV